MCLEKLTGVWEQLGGGGSAHFQSLAVSLEAADEEGPHGRGGPNASPQLPGTVTQGHSSPGARGACLVPKEGTEQGLGELLSKERPEEPLVNSVGI